MSASRQYETWSELAVRENDGLVVSLFWSRRPTACRSRS
jgi:hypothetical protein